MQEVVVEPASSSSVSNRYESLGGASPVQSLTDVQARELPRQPTGLSELDRALGGGLVDGGVILIGGDPGVGKSTLLLQAMSALAQVVPVLYVTGEESAEQVALRARRLDLPTHGVDLLGEIQL